MKRPSITARTVSGYRLPRTLTDRKMDVGVDVDEQGADGPC
ncbi:MAG: hypothetical protein OEV40_08515 [Acidimicrobiia bacterium]|nr:hypothetical protein [Acidimicrobiia bacterium]